MDLLYLGPPDTCEHVRANLPKNINVYFAIDDASVDQFIANCDIILDAYMRIRFSADRISKAAKLKLFITATTGADHVDSESLSQRGIPLLTLRDQRDVLRNITPAAEHSWLLLMACARRLRSAIQDVLMGEWDRNKHPGIMLNGKLLGIIGCGRIGLWMSRYAAAFGMQCVGFDPYLDPWPENIEKSNLESLLRRSNFISIHVPLNSETRHLLGLKEFQLMKSGSVIVNTSRGEVIDETALLSALLEGKVAAAGLDVLNGEPDIGHNHLVEYARRHDNLIITPHIGGFSPDALRFILSFSCKRVVDFFKG